MLSVAVLLLVCLIFALLAVVVIANNPKAQLNRWYGALAAFTPLWCLVVFLEDVPAARPFIEGLARLDYILASLMLAAFYGFCRTVAKKHWSPLDTVTLILVTASVVLSLLGFTAAVKMEGDDVVLVPLVGYWIFIGSLLISGVGALINLIQRYRSSRGKEHAQVTFVGLGLILTIILLTSAVVIAPRVYGISGGEVTRFGIYSTLLFAGFSAYAVIRHRFFDLRLLVVRSITYLLLLLTLAVAYAVITFQLGSLLFGDSNNAFAREAYNLSIAIVLAFTFQPLRRLFERVTAKVFYRDRYDPQAVLNAFSKVFVSEILLDKLMRISIHKLCRDLHITYGEILIFDKKRLYRQEHFGAHFTHAINPVEVLTFDHAVLVADELANGEHKALMEKYNLSVALQLKTSHNVIGYLLLGEKLSGNVYSSEDIELLEILGKELAVAVSNAKAYDEIQAFNITLKQEIAEATSQLRDSNRKLKKLDEAKNEFISMASHQLRTPLTSVKGYISMVLDGDAGRVAPAQEKLLQEAFSSAQRMVYLIGDFLNVSRIQTGKFVLEPKPTNLATVVTEEIEQLKNTAARRNISVQFTPPNQFPTLTLDETKMRQVIMNFIDNAIFYSKSGSMVQVMLMNTGRDIRFEVHDTGIGVPEAERHKLFAKFYRAENARRVRPDGTGVGLFMAKKVITAHGGSVIFETKENKGSTFGFSLPLKYESHQLVE